MNRSLKIALMGLALLLFLGSFFLKTLAPTLPDTADYVVKAIAICILIYVVVKQRIRKRPFDPF